MTTSDNNINKSTTAKAPEKKDDRLDVRSRRTDYQRGLLYIPEGVLPANRHHRFVKYQGEDMARIRSLGYRPVSLLDPEYKNLLQHIGDGTAADGHLREGDFLVVTKGTSKLILVECPLELWEQAKREKAQAANELEMRHKKKQEPGFKDSSFTQDVEYNPL